MGSPATTTGTGSNSDPDSMLWQDGSVSVTIPTFTLSGIGSNSHVEYQVRDYILIITYVRAFWDTKMQVRGSPTATTGTGSNSDPDSMLWQDGSVSVTIPTFTLSRIGSNSHAEYQLRDHFSEYYVRLF